MIYRSLVIPRALKTIAKGISLLTVLILHIIFGFYFSILTRILKIAGKVAMPFFTDLISVTQGTLASLFLKVYTKLKAILSWATTTFSEPFTIK